MSSMYLEFVDQRPGFGSTAKRGTFRPPIHQDYIHRLQA